MRYSIVVFFFFLSGVSVAPNVLYGQQATAQHKSSGTEFILPVVLIGSGLALNYTDLKNTIQQKVRELTGADFGTRADDFLPLIPAVQLAAGDALGLQPTGNFLQKTTNAFLANTLSAAIVLLGKTSFKELRPDGSNRHSFPSGHSAIAFTNAALLFYEYRKSSIAYALSGYAFAIATGYLRMANNRHYFSDVLAGAGLGMLAATVVYFCNPGAKIFPHKKNGNTALNAVTNPPVQLRIAFVIPG